MKNSLLAFLFLVVSISVSAQELNCNVIIDKQRVPDLQQSVVNDLKEAITRFMNTTRWTNDNFTPAERIKCDINISLVDNPQIGQYYATAQIQALRPVYGTSYETVILNYFDKSFNFEYNQSQPMIFNENTYTSNITSMLAFYANIILAMDYDSFSKFGGTTYAEKARNISLTAQNQADGWGTDSDPNTKIALVNDLTNQQFERFRQSIYNYHRLAMDIFLEKPEDARRIILDALTTINTVFVLRPSSILIKTFFLSKSQELIQIFSQASPDVKSRAVNLLRSMDPVNSEKYAAILRQN